MNRRLLGFTRHSKVFLQLPRVPIHILFTSPGALSPINLLNYSRKRDSKPLHFQPSWRVLQLPGSRFMFMCGSLPQKTSRATQREVVEKP